MAVVDKVGEVEAVQIDNSSVNKRSLWVLRRKDGQYSRCDF